MKDKFVITTKLSQSAWYRRFEQINMVKFNLNRQRFVWNDWLKFLKEEYGCNVVWNDEDGNMGTTAQFSFQNEEDMTYFALKYVE